MDTPSVNIRRIISVGLIAVMAEVGMPDLKAQRIGELPAGLPPTVVSAIKNYVDIPSTVKDLSCDIQFSNAPGKTIEGRFLFKAPDKVKFQANANVNYDAGVQALMTRLLFPTLAFPFFLSVLPAIEWTESKDTTGEKAQGKVVQNGKTVGTVIIEVTASRTIRRIMISESDSPRTIEIRFTSQNRNGKELLRNVEARNGNETLKWEWDYTTVGDSMLVSKATSTDETGQRQVSTCGNYKVNAGLSDTLF